MIRPTDVLVVAVAASLRRPPRARRMTRREARRAVQIAKDAWPRLWALLFADVRKVALPDADEPIAQPQRAADQHARVNAA